MQVTLQFPIALKICQRQQGDTKTLLDIALTIPKYKNSTRKLFNINTCRLFHRVTWLIEMATYNGRHINPSYLSAQFIHGTFLAWLKLSIHIMVPLQNVSSIHNIFFSTFQLVTEISILCFVQTNYISIES